ncbi:hypothetical protein ACRN9C_03590 [Shewanella frigidimarina]|uniref:hypothetical protein n=1 Tax=Shewanella frigidimarina TaxID=56812 RepID=UPI003D7AF10F
MNNFVLIKPKYIKSQIVLQAILTLDVDTNAERVAVIDRGSLQRIHNLTITSRSFSVLVPELYNSNSKLLVGILDDNELYNCQFIDGVSPEIIDGNAVLRV